MKNVFRNVNALKHAAARDYKQNIMTARRLKHIADW